MPPIRSIARLRWKVQHASYDPDGGNDLLHYARGKLGTFEIFDSGEDFLLLAPKSQSLAAELFSSLQEAKDRADEIDRGPQAMRDRNNWPIITFWIIVLLLIGAGLYALPKIIGGWL